MTSAEFKSKIENQIERVSDNERLAFALNICMRLLPEYETFHGKNKWGNPDYLAKGLKYCQRILNGEKADDYQIEEIIGLIEEVTPDTEGFGDWDGSYALNACAAIMESLEFISDKDTEHIVNVSSYMTDTVDFKVTENFGDLSDEAIDAHPWMTNERDIQIALIK